MPAISIPDQIPPQGAPFAYLDGDGTIRMESDWWLFMYGMWSDLKKLTSSDGTPSQLELPDPAPTMRELMNVLTLALDASLIDSTTAVATALSYTPGLKFNVPRNSQYLTMVSVGGM